MYRKTEGMESAASEKSQAKASQRGLSRQTRISKRETIRLRIMKPHYHPRPISERLQVVDQVENLLEDLRAAHIELGEHKPSQVKQYGSSCLLKLLERTPPPSSPRNSSSDTDPDSSGSEDCLVEEGLQDVPD